MNRRSYLIFLIIILLLTILFTTVYGTIFQQKEGFASIEDTTTTPSSTPSKKNIELVVARYNESLDWLQDDPFNKYSAIVYNKGKNEDFKHTNNIKSVIPLKNVGRCDHTYLYHVIKNYDNLADVTVFLPGSVNMSEKMETGKNVISNVEATGDTYFSIQTSDVYDSFKDFKLDSWQATYDKNAELNAESELTPANPRPFGEWFKSHFGDMKVQRYGYFGIFAVSKRHILQHPKEYYEKFMKELEVSSNPEVGHYFERAWGAVFGPI